MLVSTIVTCYRFAMARFLLTAFEPYKPWPSNASWLALVELMRVLDTQHDVTTRLYPVELQSMKDKLSADLKEKYDFVFHLGQAPRSSCIQLERTALNVATAGNSLADVENSTAVSESGISAFQSQLPLNQYAQALRQAGIPARVSFHAGTFLCNATLFWTHQLIADLELPTKATFIHIPLDTSQVIELDQPTAFMPKSMAASAIQSLIELATQESSDLA